MSSTRVSLRAAIRISVMVASCVGLCDIGLISLTIFQAYPMEAQTFQVVHQFTGGMDGATPAAGLTRDSTGNFYGTATSGGRGNCNSEGLNGCGVVFKLKRSGSGWIFQPLYEFSGGSDGAGPSGEAIIGPDGAIYGNTAAGGQGTCNNFGLNGCGTIYKLTPQPTFCRAISCPWIETPLYIFTGAGDGQFPLGELTFGPDGNLYGTAEFGGRGCSQGCGVVFELASSNGNWSESVLYSFTGGTDGDEPAAGVIFDSVGHLYGTTFGGNNDDCAPLGGECGTVFQLTHSGSAWAEATIYGFQGGMDGYFPGTGMLLDSFGNLYGATEGFLGAGGTIFELSPLGGNWSFNLLYSFAGQGPSGGRLVMDAEGNLYGTAEGAGTDFKGSVFKLTPAGNGTWIYTSLHDFTGGSDGANPVGTVAFDSAGNLYGTALFGGVNSCGGSGCGVIWEITP